MEIVKYIFWHACSLGYYYSVIKIIFMRSLPKVRKYLKFQVEKKSKMQNYVTIYIYCIHTYVRLS